MSEGEREGEREGASCISLCVYDEMIVSLCLCKRSGLLRDGVL